MKHDSLSKVAPLVALREEAVNLIDALRDGHLTGTSLLHDDRIVRISPNLVNEEHVRQAMMESAYEAIASIDKDLNALGVSTPKMIERPETLDQWKQAAEQYLRVWVREMGGKLINKRHLIDALSLTTREMYEKSQLHSEPVVSKAEHDRRVTELLEFNNKLEQRARTAERKLRAFMDGTPAARLAMAVEMAAANTLASIRTNT